MKEKTKKILAGIGICLTLGTAGAFMTGCSSDITFNQKDLDQAISNINEYLETQNNYSSEFAKNTLNGYLMNAISNSNRKSIEMTCDTYMYGPWGDEEHVSNETYKYFNSNNTIKEYTTSDNTIKYRESVMGRDNKYDTTTYTKDNQNNKTYVTQNDVESYSLDSISLSRDLLNYNSFLANIVALLNSDELGFSDFIMEQKSDNAIVFKCLACNPDYPQMKLIGSLELEFVDGNLVRAETITLAVDSAYIGNTSAKKAL